MKRGTFAIVAASALSIGGGGAWYVLSSPRGALTGGGGAAAPGADGGATLGAGVGSSAIADAGTPPAEDRPLINPRDVPAGQPTRPAPGQPITLPHGLTPQMLEWAQQLGDEMDRAQGSAETATRLFDKIEPCAEGRDRARTAAERAICLMHAQRLAEVQPAALGDRYRALESRAPDEVRRIAREFMSD